MRAQEAAIKELLAEHANLAAALLGLAVLTLLILALANALRRSARKRAGAPLAKASAHAAPVQKVKLDPAVLVAALSEAEAAGQRDRLPGLYLSLAHCRLEAGDNAEAEELLRKCIRGAGPARHKATQAKARLALGDLAQAGGDPTTACEHWQIARALFHELKQVDDHEAAEQRMLRNGCPTDWVLTDF
jgi:tetratricopeptide (TPR) repeat protein